MTVIVAGLLVVLPMAAVMVTVPLVVLPAAIVTTPAETVARLVLLEVQVATCVTSSDPLQVAAFAVRLTEGWLVVTLPLVGLTVIEVIHPTVTLRGWVAVIVGF